MLFALFYCFSLSVFNLQWSLFWPWGVLSHGRLRPGWPEGSAPWCGVSCLPGLGWSLWRCSLRPWSGISPGVVGPPKVASSMQQDSLPGHVSLVTATVWMCMSVCVCVHMCECVYECVCLCPCLWGLEGWVLLISFSWLYFAVSLFLLLFFYFCEALWGTFFCMKSTI